MKKVFIATLLFCLSSCMSHQPPPPKTGFEGTTMPNVQLLLPDSSSYFNTKSIPLGQSAVFFYFSPNCPYCRAQMREMTQNIDELKGIHLYVMTFVRFKDFKHFYDEFKVNQYPAITAGLDYTDSLGRYFKLKGVPFTAVYNSQKKLNRAFSGRISVSQIKQAAAE